MSDALVDQFIEQKVTAIASWGDYFAGSDKVAAEQLTKEISNKDFSCKEREDFMLKIKNEAAEKHLPGLELINARDTDGNGKADQFDGVKLNGRTLYERPHQEKGEKLSEKELVQKLTPYLANDSQKGSEKLAAALLGAIRDNDLNEVQLRSLLFRLEDSRVAHKYPTRVSTDDANGNPYSVDGDILNITRPTRTDSVTIRR